MGSCVRSFRPCDLHARYQGIGSRANFGVEAVLDARATGSKLAVQTLVL